MLRSEIRGHSAEEFVQRARTIKIVNAKLTEYRIARALTSALMCSVVRIGVQLCGELFAGFLAGSKNKIPTAQIPPMAPAIVQIVLLRPL